MSINAENLKLLIVYIGEAKRSIDVIRAGQPQPNEAMGQASLGLAMAEERLKKVSEKSTPHDQSDVDEIESALNFLSEIAANPSLALDFEYTPMSVDRSKYAPLRIDVPDIGVFGVGSALVAAASAKRQVIS